MGKFPGVETKEEGKCVLSIQFKKSRGQMSGGRSGYANTQPRAAIKLRMLHRRDGQREQMPRSYPGGGGEWALLELTDA